MAATMVASDDSELVQRTLSGDREAFGIIVARYQALISSLAYSATGNLGQSEDLAQETFITAWTRLGHLRERNQLRAWLCGIARNRINNALRRDNREPIRHAEPLDAIQESAATEPLPHDQAINQEEAAILWRSLEGIPATYRTPLILFYREHQSVETVADHLGLTTDAVRQRLARGRRMLQDRILTFVEGALQRSNPGKAFTLAVLASLPALAVSAKAAAVGATAAAGSTTAKSAGASLTLHALLGPLIVFVPNYLAYRMVLAGAQSDAERARVKAFYGRLGMTTLALFVPVAAVVLWLARNQAEPSLVSGLLATCLVLIFLPTFCILNITFTRENRLECSRILAEEHAGVFPKPAWEFRSDATFLGLPLVHIRIGDRFAILRSPVKAWIAIGHAAIGGLFALGAGAIAPISVGGLSIGLLSFGGLAVGGIALGGIAVGAWSLFGGLIIGWQAFNGCIAVGWSAAVGAFALAHDYALGSFAHAAHANNELARQFIFANPLFRCAELILRHWLWLNLLWIVPFYVVWRVTRTSGCGRRQTESAGETI